VPPARSQSASVAPLEQAALEPSVPTSVRRRGAADELDARPPPQRARCCGPARGRVHRPTGISAKASCLSREHSSRNEQAERPGKVEISARGAAALPRPRHRPASMLVGHADCKLSLSLSLSSCRPAAPARPQPRKSRAAALEPASPEPPLRRPVCTKAARPSGSELRREQVWSAESERQRL